MHGTRSYVTWEAKGKGRREGTSWAKVGCGRNVLISGVENAGDKRQSYTRHEGGKNSENLACLDLVVFTGKIVGYKISLFGKVNRRHYSPFHKFKPKGGARADVELSEASRK